MCFFSGKFSPNSLNISVIILTNSFLSKTPFLSKSYFSNNILTLLISTNVADVLPENSLQLEYINKDCIDLIKKLVTQYLLAIYGVNSKIKNDYVDPDIPNNKRGCLSLLFNLSILYFLVILNILM